MLNYDVISADKYLRAQSTRLDKCFRKKMGCISVSSVMTKALKNHLKSLKRGNWKRTVVDFYQFRRCLFSNLIPRAICLLCRTKKRDEILSTFAISNSQGAATKFEIAQNSEISNFLNCPDP